MADPARAANAVADVSETDVFGTLTMNLLTTNEAADFLHKPAGTLRYWRAVGIGPSYAKLGRLFCTRKPS